MEVCLAFESEKEADLLVAKRLRMESGRRVERSQLAVESSIRKSLRLRGISKLLI